MKTTFQRVNLAAGITAVVIVAIGALVIGHAIMNDGSTKPTTEQETAAAVQTLRNRSNLEDAEAQLHSAVEQIAAVATELVPGIQWEWIDDHARLDCSQPFDKTNGRMARLQNRWARYTPIPEDVWPQFLERARVIAAGVGATSPQTMKDSSGTPEGQRAHDVWFYNETEGTTIKIASDRATIISGETGCHLPQANFNDPVRPTP
ncbi:LppA family lipoprotein [Nocardia sp. CA-120079]|uniref:LppA family lipoprotein n=1 Tax=Nocardia sp. CA-120079 TaxID=3239974 RepID=UPI003D95BB68